MNKNNFINEEIKINKYKFNTNEIYEFYARLNEDEFSKFIDSLSMSEYIVLRIIIINHAVNVKESAVVEKIMSALKIKKSRVYQIRKNLCNKIDDFNNKRVI